MEAQEAELRPVLSQYSQHSCQIQLWSIGCIHTVSWLSIIASWRHSKNLLSWSGASIILCWVLTFLTRISLWYVYQFHYVYISWVLPQALTAEMKARNFARKLQRELWLHDLQAARIKAEVEAMEPPFSSKLVPKSLCKTFKVLQYVPFDDPIQLLTYRTGNGLLLGITVIRALPWEYVRIGSWIQIIHHVLGVCSEFWLVESLLGCLYNHIHVCCMWKKVAWLSWSWSSLRTCKLQKTIILILTQQTGISPLFLHEKGLFLLKKRLFLHKKSVGEILIHTIESDWIFVCCHRFLAIHTHPRSNADGRVESEGLF